MAWRVVWLLFCAAMGVSACFLQLDREARRKPVLSDNVPAVYRGFAHEGMTLRALNSGQINAANEHATALVLKRPVPAEHLAMLSLAAAAAQRVPMSNEAILYSAQRGWRAPLAQQVVVVSASDAAQWWSAADRLMALWRTGLDESVLGQPTARVLSEAGGRVEFARRLSENPGSLRRFVIWGSENIAASHYALTMEEALRLGVDVDCADLALVARNYLKVGMADVATRIWTGSCAGETQTGSTDWGFRPATAGAVGPFDWDYPGLPGLKRSWSDQEGNATLDYINRDPLNAVIAQRFTALAPGSYRLAATAQSRDGAKEVPLAFRVVCVGKEGARRRLARAVGSVNFTVPENGCDVQFIELRAPKGKADKLRLIIG